MQSTATAAPSCWCASAASSTSRCRTPTSSSSACDRSPPRPTISKAASTPPTGRSEHATTASPSRPCRWTARRTFLHLSYSYGYGMAGRLAMQGYLATVGADKVGFTVTGRDGNGQPIYIGGVRGAIERTAMRYYLAIDAHLASLSAPADQQTGKADRSLVQRDRALPAPAARDGPWHLRRHEAGRVRTAAGEDRVVATAAGSSAALW